MFWKGFYLPVTVLAGVLFFIAFTYCSLNLFQVNFFTGVLCFFPAFIILLLLEWWFFQGRMERALEERFQERDRRIKMFWSYCRHGLRNHLQMISLLAQMKYYDRMISYIDKVSVELNEWNKMLQIEHPEIALFLLHQKYHLELGTTFNLDTDLSFLNASPEDVIECLDATVKEIESFSWKNPALKINVEETEEGYVFVMYNLADSGGFLSQRAIKQLTSKIEAVGGSFTCKNFPGNLWVINLFFPGVKPEEEEEDVGIQGLELGEAGGLSSAGY